MGGAGLILLLVITGRAPWVMGVLAALMAVAGRLMQLASYIPVLKSIFGKNESEPTSSDQQMATPVAMNKTQAAEILGVDVNASETEIRAAHKRLIQKLHPARGGSDALSKQSNRAKDILLDHA